MPKEVLVEKERLFPKNIGLHWMVWRKILEYTYESNKELDVAVEEILNAGIDAHRKKGRGNTNA